MPTLQGAGAPTAHALFDAFARERRILKAVSPRTVGWYWECWRAFGSVLEKIEPAAITKSAFLPVIEQMMARGVDPVTVNSACGALTHSFGG